MILIAFLMTVIVLAVTVLSCVSDFRSLTIPNWHSLVILVCFVPAWLAAPHAFGGIGSHLGAMAIMLGMTYALFSFDLMGGGDSKLGTALGLWVGLKGLIPFLFYMSVTGGIIGVAAMIIQRMKPFKNPAPGTCIAQLQSGKNAAPYGIAISFGAWVVLLQFVSIHNQLNEVIKIIT
ncbi:MAG: prepilin peptidase [Proteobacteria bacterium]|nr:prepilin peptidase [Pseudomonadota bacterium]